MALSLRGKLEKARSEEKRAEKRFREAEEALQNAKDLVESLENEIIITEFRSRQPNGGDILNLLNQMNEKASRQEQKNEKQTGSMTGERN